MPPWFNSVLQVTIFLVLVLLITKPLGLYMTKVFSGERTWLTPVFAPVERLFYKLSGISPEEEQTWVSYVISMLIFSVPGMLLLYLLERTQQWHGSFFNPQNLPNVDPHLAFNTAASFTTNTNWQFYSGEQTMSYLTQMAGLAFHQFASAAVGIVLAIALIRGLARRSAQHLGNFWVDLVRCIFYILLPICFVGALFFVQQGMIQNFNPYTVVHTINGSPQTIAQGPVASMEIIKDLGTNGGGFFNVNSAHPFEDPNALTAIVELLCAISIGAGLFYTFGKMVGNTRQGWALWAISAIIYIVAIAVAMPAEQAGNPLVANACPKGISAPCVDIGANANQTGGNMEGKEVRYGITDSVLYAVNTTATSTGSVDSMHDSYTPLGGMVPLILIALGEMAFGGVGAGLYSMIFFVIIGVFIAGLMVGRTPEYLGKKIERKEIMMASIALLLSPLIILGFTGVAMALSTGSSPLIAAMTNYGANGAAPHGFTEVLYAFTSANGNNGSAFAGLAAGANATTNVYYNWTMGMAMLFGRFAEIIPVLAIGGSLVRKKVVPAGLGTFPTTGPLFVGLMIGIILIVGALTFFPAYALGPIIEQLFMHAGKTF
jgi:K+-transporting ATPase ATPase A chain